MKYTAGATRCRRRISDANELFAATLSGPLYTVEYLATHHGRAMQALLKAAKEWGEVCAVRNANLPEEYERAYKRACAKLETACNRLKRVEVEVK